MCGRCSGLQRTVQDSRIELTELKERLLEQERLLDEHKICVTERSSLSDQLILSTRENARLLDALDRLTKRMLQEEGDHTGSLHERERLDSERRSLQVRVEAQDAQCRQLQQRLDEQQRLLGRSEEQKTRLERLAECTAEENERLRAESGRMQAENRKARQVRGTGVHVLVMELRTVHGSLWA